MCSHDLTATRSAYRAAARLLLALTALWTLCFAVPAAAHEVRPALMRIVDHGTGRYEVTWKQPLVGDMGLRLTPHMSGGALERSPDAETASPGFLLRSWRVVGGAPLEGQTISIEGLEQSVTDVLVQVESPGGRTYNTVLHPADPSLKLTLSGPQGVALPAYLTLGVEHILTGFDHLAFVLALLLLVGPGWRIVKTVTGFTLAHSITLALAALGYVRFPTALIEALVALSIVFVAAELLPRRDGRETLTRRRPWLIAFVFGLLHGLAFAGALAQIGLPAKSEPAALLLFNLGVEAGQLLFIAAAAALILILRRIRPRLTFDTTALARTAPAYVIGGVAAYWTIDRVLAALA